MARLTTSILCSLFCNVLVSANYAQQEFIPGCKRNNRTLTCIGGFPKNIPEGVDEIIVNEYEGDIDSDMFSDTSWTKVRSLNVNLLESITGFCTVKSNSFQKVTGLKNLGLHGRWISIENDTFKGIGSMFELDLSGCIKLTMHSIMNALNGSDRISQLSVLNISQVDLDGGDYDIQTRFTKIMGSKGIVRLNISHVPINRLNMSALTTNMCDSLEYVDLSSTSLPWLWPFYSICKSLRRIDMNNADIRQRLVLIIPKNIYLELDLESVPSFSFFSNIDVINGDGLVRDFPNIQNVTIAAQNFFEVKTKNLSLSNNGIQYLDFKSKNVSCAIEFLNLSWNRLTYLQPLFLTDSSPLQHLDLSHNILSEMALKHYKVFGTLLKFFKLLKIVNLRDNRLTDFPPGMFQHNLRIESIDLSNNLFEQIGFELGYNSNLTDLNLRGNRITRLSDESIQVLTKAIEAKKTLTVDIRDNALLCNDCECKTFIKWVVAYSENVKTDGICIGEKGNKEILDTSTVLKINRICTRSTRIALSTSLPIASAIIIVIVVVMAVKLIRRKSKATKVNRVLNQIRDGDYRYDFPVFVASSGHDEGFVEHMVTRPLIAHLRDMIGTNKDLICTGDKHFKLGKSIAEETERSYRRCGVVLLVISPSFCASTHCNYEAHIAFTMRKPIILMFKEHVPPEEMPPVLRMIFRMYTRVTWKVHGGQYVMSTTWQNVCESILELMVDQPRLNRQDCLEVVSEDE